MNFKTGINKQAFRLYIGLILCLFCQITTAIETLELNPTQAQDFTLPSLTSTQSPIRLKEQTGNVILLNFWASWCSSCREEIPHLNALYEKYQPEGFKVIGINLDSNPETAQHFLLDTPVQFSIVIDQDKDISESYDISAMPTTYLIDRKGQLRYLHKGYEAGLEATYETQIKALLIE